MKATNLVAFFARLLFRLRLLRRFGGHLITTTLFRPLRSGGWFIIWFLSLHSDPFLIVLPSRHTTAAIGFRSAVPILIPTTTLAATNARTVPMLIFITLILVLI